MIPQSPQFTLGFTVGVVYSMGFDKCIMTHIHHYDLSLIVFIALKILSAQSIHPSFPSPQSIGMTNLFTVSIVLPFPESHIVVIIQYIAFSDRLLSLSNMHLRFLHVSSWINSSSLFIAE